MNYFQEIGAIWWKSEDSEEKKNLLDNNPCFLEDRTRTPRCDSGGRESPDWGRRTRTCS